MELFLLGISHEAVFREYGWVERLFEDIEILLQIRITIGPVGVHLH